MDRSAVRNDGKRGSFSCDKIVVLQQTTTGQAGELRKYARIERVGLVFGTLDEAGVEEARGMGDGSQKVMRTRFVSLRKPLRIRCVGQTF